jgi:hypothetical protein
MQLKLFALKRLMDSGLITEKDFESKKSVPLNNFLGLSATAITTNTTSDMLKQYADIEFGKYHALVIGITEYKYLAGLKTAVADAQEVAKVLEEDYGFAVTLLINPIHLEIVDALDELSERLSYEDNLLIYYAGHGWLNEDTGRGYWLPADGKPNRRGRWVSNTVLRDTLKSLQAKHVMVVADSCFSGTLVRGDNVSLRGGNYFRRMAEKQARVAITSGGLEPVADAGGGGHSPFA